MKLSSPVSSLHPAVATLVLLPLLVIGWAQQAAGHPVDQALSPPLRNPETYQAAHEVSRHAQRIESAETEDDSSTRLMPRVNTSQDHLKICCLYANILQFYLNHILPYHSNQSLHMHRLKADLSRVSDDLQTQGCNVTKGRHHLHTVEFSRKFDTIGERRFNKAVAEIDILFTQLQYYCVHTKNDQH